MADFGVVGAGVIGLSTAFALVERGASVTIYERGVPGNSQSGGESRIFRHLHDDPRLVAFACDSRTGWRQWEERFGEELLSPDGVVAVGPGIERRLQVLREVGGIPARPIDSPKLVESLPIAGEWDAPAIFDEDGGVLRARAAIAALCNAVRDRLVFDEVLSVRTTAHDTVEVRAGGISTEHDRVVLCAGRGTAALARSAGLPLPIRQAAHVRLTFRVRGRPPARLACVLDGSGAFAEGSVYGDPLPGNGAYAVGLGETVVREDGSLLDAAGFGETVGLITAYVTAALPGLDPEPVEVRHCWVTELPWSPDGIAVWELGGLLVLAGNNLFKHAPALGQALAGAVVGEQQLTDLRAAARIGSPLAD